MKRYWIRLSLKVIAVLLCLVGIIYFVERQYPGKVDWRSVFEITNRLMAAWGTIVIAFVIIIYIGYTREKLTTSLGPHLLEIKNNALEMKQSLSQSIEKADHTLEKLNAALDSSKKILDSGEWEGKLEQALQHLQQQGQKLIADMELKTHTIEVKQALMEAIANLNELLQKVNASVDDLQKTVGPGDLKEKIKKAVQVNREELAKLAKRMNSLCQQMVPQQLLVPEQLSQKIEQKLGEESFNKMEIIYLIEKDPELDRDMRTRLIDHVKYIDRSVGEITDEFRQELSINLEKSLGPEARDVLEAIQGRLPVKRLPMVSKNWLLRDLLGKNPGPFDTIVEKMNFSGMIVEGSKKFLNGAALSWLKGLIGKKKSSEALPEPRD